MLPKLLTRTVAAVTIPVALGTTLAATAGTASAAARYVTLARPSLYERVAPTVASPAVGSLPFHTSILVECQTVGSTVYGSRIWDRLVNGRYVADYYVSTPDFGFFSPGLPRCTSTPTAAAGANPTAPQIGETTYYDQGAPGQCTWWADYEFHAYSKVWPDFVVYRLDNANARSWAVNAAHNGWTVTSTPTRYSIAVFPPGVDGAGPWGHVAWVTGVATTGTGPAITVTEEDFPKAGHVDLRTLEPASSVRYIVAP